MYKPSLGYMFVVSNPRSLWPQLSLMKYLDSVDVSYYVMVQVENEKKIIAEGTKNRVFVNSMNYDYDVTFSQSAGLDKFERDCLIDSRRLGKVNIKLHNSMSTNNTVVNPNYTTERVNGRIHGICTREQRAIDHFSKFLPHIFYLNTGDPDWDYFKTPEFEDQVNGIKMAYDNKLLLICSPFVVDSFEEEFWSLIIKWSINSGYNPVIRAHPGREKHVPKDLSKYLCMNVHRHVLMAAASHVIVETCSTVIGECMMLGTKVGSFPLVPHFPEYQVHKWVDNHIRWTNLVRDQIGELVDYVPLIHTRSTFLDFINDRTPLINQEEMDRIWGWPRVGCYSEYLFKCVEGKFGIR